jgi:hypothetical protein
MVLAELDNELDDTTEISLTAEDIKVGQFAVHKVCLTLVNMFYSSSLILTDHAPF